MTADPDAKAPSSLCQRCHILDGRKLGRAVTAGCVHGHITTLTVCPEHEERARVQVEEGRLWCQWCCEAGHDKVPVRILTPVGSAS